MTTISIAGLRSSGTVAPYVVDFQADRDIFEAWIEQALLHESRPGDTVIMYSLANFRGSHPRALIPSHSASMIHMPACSPDFNPIENGFAKLKALLRYEGARTVDAVWSAIGRLIDLITPQER